MNTLLREATDSDENSPIVLSGARGIFAGHHDRGEAQGARQPRRRKAAQAHRKAPAKGPVQQRVGPRRVRYGQRRRRAHRGCEAERSFDA